jgi:glycosyltransferase involved in cell wall biosynthesis
MKVLFAHRFLPGQFKHVAGALAARGDTCVFLHADGDAAPPGVQAVRFQATRRASSQTHHYLQGLENAVLDGQAAYRAARALAQTGFRPDVIFAHAGFGPGLYLAEAFRGAPILGHFEWFYSARGADADFIDPGEVTSDDELRIRTRNAQLLLELEACRRGVVPTEFQFAQFPEAYRHKLKVIHEGIDVEFFAPGPVAPADLGYPGLPDDAQLVVYATRGLEAYRGFPAFMEAVALLQERHPRMHALILGEDRTFYGRPPASGAGWKAIMLKRLGMLDQSRIHFLGSRPLEEYRRVLQAAHAHVYLTVPFVLSWSLLEAMACAAPIVGSDTAPVREVIADRDTGLLADLRTPSAIADAVSTLLEDRALGARLGGRAREVAVERYALARLLPQQIAFVEEVSRQAQPWISTPKRTRSRSGPSLQSDARLNRVK